MNRLAFYFWTALKNIVCDKLLNTAKFATSLFCMATALLLLASYVGGVFFLRGRCDFKNITELQMYVAEDVNSLPDDPENAEHFVFYGQNSAVTFEGAYLGGVGLVLTDVKFADLFDDFLLDGEYFDAESECVVGYETAAKYKIGISESVTIGSKAYAVRGICKNEGYRRTIMICDPRALDLGCPRLYISSVPLSGSGIVYKGDGIRDYFGSMTDISDLLPVFAVCAFMLFFSAVNIFNIAVIYGKKTAPRVRIRRSLGASKRSVFAVRFIENSIINALAFIAALALSAAVKGSVSVILSTTLKFTAGSVLPIVLLSALLSMFYSAGRYEREDVCIL